MPILAIHNASHTDDSDDVFLFADLVNQAILDIGASGVSAFQIAAQLLESRRVLEGVCCESR